MRNVDEATASCASVKTVQLSAQKSLAVVKTKMELNSHADKYVVVITTDQRGSFDSIPMQGLSMLA